MTSNFPVFQSASDSLTGIMCRNWADGVAINQLLDIRVNILSGRRQAKQLLAFTCLSSVLHKSRFHKVLSLIKKSAAALFLQVGELRFESPLNICCLRLAGNSERLLEFLLEISPRTSHLVKQPVLMKSGTPLRLGDTMSEHSQKPVVDQVGPPTFLTHR